MTHLAPRRRWLLALCMSAGALYAGLACAFAQPAVMHVDGNSYFEMARGLSAILGFDNGHATIDSIELYLPNSVLIGERLVAKYPPLYALFGVPAYALLGVRGLSVLEALAMGACVPLVFRVARRVMPDRWALAVALACPFCTQLFSYGLVAIPHALAACLLLAAIDLALVARERASTTFAALAGVVSVLAVGVRHPTLVPLALLPLVLASGSGDRRGRFAAFLLPCGIGALGLGAINLARFGVLSPISYGPPGHLGSPIELESAAELVTGLDLIGVAACLVAILVAGRFGLTTVPDPKRTAALIAAACGIAGLALIEPLRERFVELVESAFALLVDHRALMDGAEPLRFDGIPTRSLIEGSPLLALGAAGAATVVVDRRREPLARTLAAMALIAITFLSTRQNDDLLAMGNVLGWPTLGPRYLVSIEPLLLIVAAHVVHYAGPSRALLGVAVLAALFSMSVSVRDARTFARITERHAGWMASLDAELPERAVIFGSGGGMHGIHPLRGRDGSLVLADVRMDGGADAARVADAFDAEGRALYYFGVDLEVARAALEPRYEITQVLRDPLLFRIERR